MSNRPMTLEERFAWRAANFKPSIFGLFKEVLLGCVFDNMEAYPGDPVAEPQRSVAVRVSNLAEYVDSNPPEHIAFLRDQGVPLESCFYYEFCLD